MQKYFVFILWTLLALILQTTILQAFPGRGVWTDLVFYLVIILGLRFRLSVAVIVTCLFGYIIDVLTFAPNGMMIISYLVVVLFIKVIRDNIYIEERVSLFFWVILFSLMRQVVQVGLMTLSSDYIEITSGLVFTVLLQALWDSLLGIFIIQFIEKAMIIDFRKYFRRRKLRA